MNFLALAIVGFGVAIGLGMIGLAAMNGMSRQPEAIGKMQTAMLIALAFVELVFLLGFVAIAFLIQAAPNTPGA